MTWREAMTLALRFSKLTGSRFRVVGYRSGYGYWRYRYEACVENRR